MRQLLLDTHIFIAIIEEREEHLAFVRAYLNDADVKLFVSVASLWEIAIKCRLGKLPLLFPLTALPGAATSNGMTILPVNAHHALHMLSPEPPTRDPFDRLLLAQCATEDMRLVTIDRALVGHPLSATAGPE